MPPPLPKKKKSKHTHWKYCLFFFLCPADHFLCCRFQKQSLNLIVLLAVIMTPSAPGSRAITSLFFYSQTQREISFFFLWSWKVSISLINLFAIYTQCSIYICTLRYPDSQSNPLSKGRMRKRVRRKILWGETTKLHVIHVAERILRFMEPEKTKLPGSSSG